MLQVKPSRMLTPLLLAAVMAGAGCHSLMPAGPALAPIRQPVPELGPDHELITRDKTAEEHADALASFCKGLVDEYYNDPRSAISNYLETLAYAPDNEDLYLRVTIGLLQQKRIQEAAALMENFSRRHPRSEKSLMILAVIYRAIDQPDKVVRIYRRLIALAPKKPNPYIELASMYVKQGRDNDAVRLLERAIRRVDDPIDLLRVLGALYVQKASSATGKSGEVVYRNAAIRDFEQIRAKSTGDVAVLFQLGSLYIRGGLIPKGLDCYQLIESKDPDDLTLKQKLALSFVSVLGRDQAIAALEEQARRRTEKTQVYYYLGDIFDNKDDSKAAISNFWLAARSDPGNPSPILRIAILQMVQDSEAALKTLRDSLKTMPDNPRLMEMTAYVYFTKKDYEKSVKYFEQAEKYLLKKTPENINPSFLFSYGLARQLAGQIDEAADLLNRAITQNLSLLDAYLQFAFRQEDVAQQKDSIRVLEQIGQLQPDEPRVDIYLGFLNSYLKYYEPAVAAFEKAENLLEDSPLRDDILDATFYFWYGAACERLGQIERAEKLFGKCLEIDPSYSDALNYLAYMWAEKGIHLDRALKYVNQALDLTPTSGAYIDTLGWIYYMQGQYKEAFNEINKAMEIIPNDPTIHEHLGDVLLKLGDEKQALPHWKRSFILDPENAKLADKLRKYNTDLAPLRKQAEELKKSKASETNLPPIRSETIPLK